MGGGTLPAIEGIAELARRIAEIRNQLDAIQQDFQSMFPALEGRLTARRIILELGAEYKIPVADLTNTCRRTPEIVRVRHYAAWLIRRGTKLSYNQIAKLFGVADHTTIMVWEKKHNARIQEVANVDG